MTEVPANTTMATIKGETIHNNKFVVKASDDSAYPYGGADSDETMKRDDDDDDDDYSVCTNGDTDSDESAKVKADGMCTYCGADNYHPFKVDVDNDLACDDYDRPIDDDGVCPDGGADDYY